MPHGCTTPTTLFVWLLENPAGRRKKEGCPDDETALPTLLAMAS